jgi:hypothetical protein
MGCDGGTCFRHHLGIKMSRARGTAQYLKYRRLKANVKVGRCWLVEVTVLAMQEIPAMDLTDP